MATIDDAMVICSSIKYYFDGLLTKIGFSDNVWQNCIQNKTFANLTDEFPDKESEEM